MIEPGTREHAEGLRRQAHCGCDEIAVKTGIARGLDDLGEVTPSRGLSAGEMHLQHAESGRFAKNTCPRRSVQLVVTLVERERIGAIRTAEWTTMRELGKQAERRRYIGAGRRHKSPVFRSSCPA